MYKDKKIYYLCPKFNRLIAKFYTNNVFILFDGFATGDFKK